MKKLMMIMVVLVGMTLWSCSQFSAVPNGIEKIRVNSIRDRWILRTIKLTPRSSSLIDLNLLAFDDEEFAQFKAALGLVDKHVFARGSIQLVLSPDGTVLNVIGSFEAQVGEHWRYVPEVQKIPTLRPNKKLTIGILSRLSMKGLL